jgi:putative transposase
MARLIRLEFSGAIYHVTSRGNRKEAIFRNDQDRYAWLRILAAVCARFRWTVYAFCEMGNHYHLLIETRDATLARGMRQLNGVYTQQFNYRHETVGHVFQGRYKAILVQRQTYLMELIRYVVLNPVRAGLVATPGAWPWSSHVMVSDAAKAPEWLDTEWLLGQFSDQHDIAVRAYREFVAAGRSIPSPFVAMRHQDVLGDDDFFKRYGAGSRLALQGPLGTAPASPG